MMIDKKKLLLRLALHKVSQRLSFCSVCVWRKHEVYEEHIVCAINLIELIKMQPSVVIFCAMRIDYHVNIK